MNNTCNDCKHFNRYKHPKPDWIGYGYCEKRVSDGYKEYPSPDSEICSFFEPSDIFLESSWESVSK